MDPIAVPLEIDRLADDFPVPVHIPDKSDDAVRFMKLYDLRLILSAVLKMDRKFRIQISCLMQTALDICR
jgi:hypothetical protein